MPQALFGHSWPEALIPQSRRGRYPGRTIERVFLPQVLIGEPKPRYNDPPINQGPGLPGNQLKGHGWDHGYHPLSTDCQLVDCYRNRPCLSGKHTEILMLYDENY